MKRFWLRGLALSLGLVVAGGRAPGAAGQQPIARSSPPPAAAPTVPDKPVTIASTRPRQTPPAPPAPASQGPAASLGRPVAAASPPVRTDAVQPVSFTAGAPQKPVVRGAAADLASARPMPAGPMAEPVPPNLHGWRRGNGLMAAGRNEAAAPPLPGPGSGGTILPTPAPAPAPAPAPVPDAPPSGVILPTPAISPTLPPLSSGGIGSVPLGPGVISTGPPPVIAGTPAAVVPFPGPPNCSCAPAPVDPRCACAPVAGCVGTPAGAACAWPEGCPGQPRLSLSAEYLLWWFKGDPTPPLVSIGPNNATGAFLNDPSTQILYGGQDLGRSGISGARIGAQYWFSDEHLWGIDAGAFFVGEDRDRFRFDSTGDPRLGRPIINNTLFILDPANNPVLNPGFGLGDAELVAGLATALRPGTAGFVEVIRRSTLWGYDLNLRRNLICDGCLYVDALAGFRSIGLDESLGITEFVQVTNPNLSTGAPSGFLAGDSFRIQDKFSTTNRFYGGQLGFDAQLDRGNWTFGLKGKLGVGYNSQSATISGTTLRTLVQNEAGDRVGAGQLAGEGGLLALKGTNIGSYTRRKFCVVPEVGFTAGYNFSDWCRVFAGYNFMYVSSVLRPGQQVDQRVNAAFQPSAPAGLLPPQGPQAPAPLLKSTDFYAHGVSFGLEFRY